MHPRQPRERALSFGLSALTILASVAALATTGLLSSACTPRTEEPVSAALLASERAGRGSTEGGSAALAGPFPLAPQDPGPSRETTLADVRSPYSHFLVRDLRATRSLYFIRDSGEIVLESAVDRHRPHDLLVEYTRTMFASFLVRPEQSRSLIVGLGGGAMIHYLTHFAPEQKVDVVEIDPSIVKAADEHFGVRSEGNVKVLTEDAFAYLSRSTERYDVIYMDAFLKPSADTDGTGVPLRMKTLRFLQSLERTLSPGGLVVFNLNEHEATAQDLDTLEAAFARTYHFPGEASGNYVVVGSTSPNLVPPEELARNAAKLDAFGRSSFSYGQLAKRALAPRR